MKELNEEIQSDMKINVRITWADLLNAALGWLGEPMSALVQSIHSRKPARQSESRTSFVNVENDLSR